MDSLSAFSLKNLRFPLTNEFFSSHYFRVANHLPPEHGLQGEDAPSPGEPRRRAGDRHRQKVHDDETLKSQCFGNPIVTY